MKEEQGGSRVQVKAPLLLRNIIAHTKRGVTQESEATRKKKNNEKR
jgi:hypothetical protein